MNLWEETRQGNLHPAKFGGRRHSGSGDMFLVFIR